MDAFRNEDECLELYFWLKFGGCDCRRCGRPIVNNYVRVQRRNSSGFKRRSFRCKSCHTEIFPLSNTIFRKSTIHLTDIFYVIYMMCSGSTSAIRMTGDVRITYKTAHKLMMLIRIALLHTEKLKMNGTVEIDEAFFGTGSKSYNWSGISTRKQPIMGFVDRETKQARIFLVPNRSAATIHALVKKNVEYGSTIYTDSWRGYNGLDKYYIHETVDHSKREFVRGDVHTNTIENLWGGFKRNLRKSHIKISDKYVHLYMAEACWRYNSKGKTTMQLFDDILKRTFFSPFSY